MTSGFIDASGVDGGSEKRAYSTKWASDPWTRPSRSGAHRPR